MSLPYTVVLSPLTTVPSPSNLRSMNQPSVADPKYEGKRISRKDLMGDEGEDVVLQDEDAEGESVHEDDLD